MKETMLHGKRRNAMEIVANILEEASNGINKTRLVYRTNLNFLLIQRYIDYLVGKELLEVKSNPSTVYVTTQKGKDLLAEFSKIKEIVGVQTIQTPEGLFP
jgi:predicted transcriptional regulator